MPIGVCLCLEQLDERVVPAIFTVTNTDDEGAGSLRQAMLDATDNGEADTIRFEIGEGVRTIRIGSTTNAALPVVTQDGELGHGLIIDGRSPAGFPSQRIVLDASPLEGPQNGVLTTGVLRFAQARDSAVYNLTIANGYNTEARRVGSGIVISSSSNISVAGCFIGTDVTGTQTRPNFYGVDIYNSSDCQIGTADTPNVISGNHWHGIVITGDASTAISIRGNYIGTDALGLTALGNGEDGVSILGGQGQHRIGSGENPGEGNIIAGNVRHGIFIREAELNRIEGNIIGAGVLGLVAVPNQGDGVRIEYSSSNTVGGTAVASSNLISGNGGAGVAILQNDSENPVPEYNVIVGNVIGLNSLGNAALPNSIGVLLDRTRHTSIGTGAAGARNVISGNGVGILADHTADTDILGNLIGTSFSGDVAIGNRSDGVYLKRAVRTVIGDVGVNSRNIVSGNGFGGNRPRGNGIHVELSPNTTISNNFIGLDITGEVPLGNNRAGILVENSGGVTIGGDVPIRNVIAANGGEGISAANNAIPFGEPVPANQANNLNGKSATEKTGRQFENKQGSVRQRGDAGLFNGEKAFGTLTGVTIEVGTGNRIGGQAGDSFLSAGGLGIDLNADGITPNDLLDADAGPNGLQNFPLLASAVRAGAGVLLNGRLDSAPFQPYTIDFYGSDTPWRAGQQYLGSLTVTADADGYAPISVTLSGSAPDFDFLTATATAADGSTSEFSNAALVSDPGTVAGLVWDDFNGNGLQDPNEPGIAGVTVRLLDDANGILASTTTGTNGFYSFSGFPAATGYAVEVVAPAGSSFVALDAGNDDTRDSDVFADGRTATFAPPGMSAVRRDAGITRPRPPASVTLASSDAPSVYGQAVTLTATVSAGATGTVTFFAGSLGLGTGAIIDGTASVEVAWLPAGTHSVTAVFNGDANFAASTSTPLTQTVNAAGTTVALASSANPSTVGDAVTFTATVSALAPGGGLPAGSVVFSAEGGALGTASLDANGVASLTVSSLVAGTHTITADYLGSIDHAASFASLSQQVNAPPPAAVGDRVWRDLNGNGVQDAGEPGVGGVLVELVADPSQVVLASTVSDANGVFLFGGLAAGSYRLRFVAPPGLMFTTLLAGSNTAADSDAAPNGTTAAFTLAAGQLDPTRDAGLLVVVPPGAVGLTAGGYTQNFNTLPVAGSAGWSNGNTLPGWHALFGASPPASIVANNGTNFGGGLFADGATGVPERALGVSASGAGAASFGLWLVNTTGATINTLTISYWGEQWSGGNTAAQTLAFSFSTSATSLDGPGYTGVGALDFVTPVVGGPPRPLDGNAGPNRVLRTATISGLNLAPGQGVWLKWTAFDLPGFDSNLAIDDLSVTLN